MRFGALGPLAVWTDKGEPVTVPGRKVRGLLAALLVHEGRAVSVDGLVESLWGEAAPADPSAALHVRVSQLRRALEGAESGGRDLVVSQAPGYALRTTPEAVDATRFAALLNEAAQTADDPRTRAGLLAEALGLWRGPALADFADEEFTRAAAARWEEQRLAAVEAHAEARLDLGEHRELAGELGEQVTLHPYRERLRATHMRALHRAGRTSEALDSFHQMRQQLADELGLDPGPELAALHRALLAGDPAEAPPAPAAPANQRPVTNLPAPVTDLIGREPAVQRIRELLASGRLVTLTGPGGVGKTSVAVAVGRAVAETYPGGAWLVDLTAWDGQGDPAEPVLAALSIPDPQGGSEPAGDRLATALGDRRALLVLDNCEHVVEQMAGLLGELLPVAPGLRVLATSREPLRLRGEARWELPPLDVPDTDDPGRLARSPAVQLFLARAGLASAPETAAGLAVVAEICRRLDGIPLALELAATRVPALGVSELATRLRVPQDRFGLLRHGPRDAPERQRTLGAVIDWSWQLLAEDERAVLRRLAVHAGGCTLAAAEAVCGGEVLDVLAGLVDRSLVTRTEGPRFRLLESVSAYCLDRLREAGEEDEQRRRHADHYLALAEQAEPRLRGPGQREWLHRLDAEAANLRVAMETFRRAGAAVPALRLAKALVWYWFLRGRLAEARRALAGALAVPGDAPAALRSAVEAWEAGLAIRQGQAGQERAFEVLQRYDRTADPAGRARAEWFLATSIIDFGDATATGELLERALETFRATGDRWGEAAVLGIRAMLAHVRVDQDALEHDARRSAELFGELGDDWGVLQATDWLIGLADMTGDHAEAARLSREGLRIAEDLGLWSDVAGRLGWLAWISVQVGDYTHAYEYGEQAKRLTAEQGLRVIEVFATISLAFAARRSGRLDTAEEHLRWLLASARQQQTADNYPPYLSMVLAELGFLAGLRNDPAAALTWHREAFDVCTPSGMAWALVGMADALVLDGRPGLAAQLLGAADATRQKNGQPMSVSEREEVDRITAAARAAEPGFADLFARGGEHTPEEALSLLDGDRA
ncbi:BTAD domain-containing putative transcriptional regulator [Dactylosporangium fulvum]|uniref:Winged helix-turn-helix domain-containing protein n=1 Tax=Dactylosporangium fulvum TaxID=53359 RepID=A0ABY5VVW5_9ACTN|nr:BTAD domain-containing putative transcriptional regulator [Dactylosporangium fulvum]UWP81372.1 winged helix-turn-helix domain-containing protein [Dactylosporangium fulvum]